MKRIKYYHFLVADDNEACMKVWKRIIQAVFPGSIILEATNGEEALVQFYAVDHIDLVLTNYDMPKINGIQLIETIRSIDMEIPIVMISGGDYLAEALEAGANAFIAQPAEHEEIIRILKEVLKIAK
jgi:YesN/AraC family two-component response regulator